MKRKGIVLRPLLVFTLGLLALSAQNPPPFPPDPETMVQHRIRRLTTLLSLTSAQQTQALSIFSKSETSVSNVFERMKTAHEDLQGAVKKNDVNAIDAAATTIGNLTKELTADHALADAAFYQILTPDQQTKFAELDGGVVGFAVAGPGGPVQGYSIHK